MMGLPLAILLGVPLMLAHDVQSFRFDGLHPSWMTARLVIPLLIWLSVFAILSLRLFGVRDIVEWYMD
jgi:hypothetical protein